MECSYGAPVDVSMYEDVPGYAYTDDKELPEIETPSILMEEQENAYAPYPPVFLMCAPIPSLIVPLLNARRPCSLIFVIISLSASAFAL